MDMNLPGVDMRPIHQIDGGKHFNEIFFTDVRIPDANRMGGVGDGWRVSLTTLMNERVLIGGGIPRIGGGTRCSGDGNTQHFAFGRSHHAEHPVFGHDRDPGAGEIDGGLGTRDLLAFGRTSFAASALATLAGLTGRRSNKDDSSGKEGRDGK